MTCTPYASSAHELAPAPWLHSASAPGPRSPRIRLRSEGPSGPVISTATNWMPVSWQDTDYLALLQEARALLIEELAELRRKHRSTVTVLSELRAVTHEIMRVENA